MSYQSTDNENNNNGCKRGDKVPDLTEITENRSKKPLLKDKMGSKGKKSKGEDKKSKKEDAEQVAGDTEEGKKKKIDKKKKGSVKGDSDEDTKKTKSKKNKKVENYAEIYENELLSYEPDKVENYEDEYHKKKGKCSTLQKTETHDISLISTVV